MRRYTFKLYPNAAQTEALESMRALHSGLYNGLLQQRIEAYQRGQWTLAPRAEPRAKRGVTLTYYDQCKGLTALRAEMPEYAALSSGSMAATAQRVDRAFQAFFRRAKAGAGSQAGFPRFKRCEGFGFKKHNSGWNFSGTRLRMQAIPGLVRARGKFPAQPEGFKTCDVMLRAGVWWLSVVAVMPARMKAEQDQIGEVEFDLVDSFARVRREDGGCVAGPEETVYAAADGRITPVFAGCYAEAGADTPQICGVTAGESLGRTFTVPGADTPQAQGDGRSGSGRLARRGADSLQTRGDRRRATADCDRAAGADTPQTRGDRGPADPQPDHGSGAETPQTQGDRRIGPMLRRRGAAADSLQTRGDRGKRASKALTSRGADIQQMQDERRGTPRRSPSRMGADTPQTQGERRWSRSTPNSASGADTPQTQADRRAIRLSVPVADTPQTRSDRRKKGRPKAGADTPQAQGDRRHPVRPCGADSLQTQDERRGTDGAPEGRLGADSAQRAMSRCKRGSCKYRAAKLRHARAEARRARQRREALHLWTTSVARRFARLTIISPPLVEATKSGAGDQREWGAMVDLKAEMNRRVLQQAPAAAIQMLCYKIAERGGVTETKQKKASPSMAGNLIVEAAKANRKLRRAARA